VTKGVSENAKGKIAKAADAVIYPVKLATGHNTIATSRSNKTDPSEREDFDEEGNVRQGFADSLVPTLEEKTIFERRPSGQHPNGQALFDLVEEGEQPAGDDGGAAPGQNQPSEAAVPGEPKKTNPSVDSNVKDGKTGVPKVRGDPGEEEKFGAPANAHQGDDKPPTKGRGGKGEDDEEPTDPKRRHEQEMAVKARKTLRKHLNSKTGMSPWSMPTPTPKVNPNRFHDPLDDKFWKDMWVAVAVHNVSDLWAREGRLLMSDRNLPKGL
jgi:phospholipase D1/2